MHRPSKLAYMVVAGQILIAIILVVSLCGCLFYKTWADPSILSALIVLTGTIIGNLGSILGGPNRMKQVPEKMEISNTPDKPVPVTESPP